MIALLLGLTLADADAHFETHIRPLLATHCYECHAADAERIEGGFQLDSREAMLAGGDSGPAIVPGDAEASYLIEVLRDVDYEMPPAGPLNATLIDTLAEWIDAGAHWPDTGDGPALVKEAFDLDERRSSHWCWQPIADPPPPTVRQTDWPTDPLDAFALARIEAAGLAPSRPTDRLGWLRRASLAIRGLPPSIDQQTRFAADTAPGAYERMADELLASPQFGETWARHWLDVVRFAESYGHEFDLTVPHAHRYRDYVVRAFNDDLPFDAFAREQIAGDLLQPRLGSTGLNDAQIATGFWHLGEAMGAPVDAVAEEADRIDNQIDTFSKAFLGLTVACARCHDHKFDAISTADYYALYGSLRSTRRILTPIDPHGQTAAAVAAIDAARSELPAPSPVQPIAIPLRDGDAALPPMSEWTRHGLGFTQSDEPTVDWKRARVIPPGVATSSVRADGLAGVTQSPPFVLSHKRIGLLIRTTGQPKSSQLKVHLVVANHFMNEKGRQLQLEGTIRLKPNHSSWGWLDLSGRLDKFAGERVYLEIADYGPGTIDVAGGLLTGVQLPAVPEGQSQVAAVPLEMTAKLDTLAAAIPPPQIALASADAAGADEPIRIRGSVTAHGELTSRGFLDAFDPAPSSAPGSRRLEIATQTTDPGNPLFARVAVNRIWHHLFGRGLVPTPDDFGQMGTLPSHPQLLDRLATDFIAGGYSTKAMIRRVVLSATYRQASGPASMRARAVDPKNVLLARFPVRRLPAEAIRDSLLSVSGRLNLDPPAASVPVHLVESHTGRGRPGRSGPLDGNGHRSLYLEVRRNFLDPTMLAFDRPAPVGPVGRRSRSNVPAQSLTLLNNPLVLEQARVTAERLAAEAAPFDDRLDRLWQRAFTRLPTSTERAAIATFAAGRNDADTWSQIAHAVFNMKEFVFVP